MRCLVRIMHGYWLDLVDLLVILANSFVDGISFYFLKYAMHLSGQEFDECV